MNEQTKKVSEDDALLFALFDKWAQNLENEEAAAEQKKAVQLYADANGIPFQSPAALMYGAFLGGIDTGLELAEVFKNK